MIGSSHLPVGSGIDSQPELLFPSHTTNLGSLKAEISHSVCVFVKEKRELKEEGRMERRKKIRKIKQWSIKLNC